jgi:hypothetical protein
LLQQFLTNQFGYGSLTFTALTDATRDFAIGLAGIPPSLQTAFQALAAGDPSLAVSAVGDALIKVFYTGLDASNLSNIQLLGTIGDLLPPVSIPGDIAQNFTNVLQTITDTNISANLTTASMKFGLPLAFAIYAVGSPITTVLALGDSATTFISAVQAGNLQAALTALVGAPANALNGFLNGEATIPLPLPPSVSPIPVQSITANIPIGGILSPLRSFTATTVSPPLPPITIPLSGTPGGGLIPALISYVIPQLAASIA